MLVENNLSLLLEQSEDVAFLLVGLIKISDFHVSAFYVGFFFFTEELHAELR